MEKIIVNNFGPIKEINFCLDKQFNVVIGEQATGKSTLAKCIYFFKDVITEMTHLLMGQPEKLAKMTAEQILQLYCHIWLIPQFLCPKLRLLEMVFVALFFLFEAN